MVGGGWLAITALPLHRRDVPRRSTTIGRRPGDLRVDERAHVSLAVVDGLESAVAGDGECIHAVESADRAEVPCWRTRVGLPGVLRHGDGAFGGRDQRRDLGTREALRVRKVGAGLDEERVRVSFHGREGSVGGLAAACARGGHRGESARASKLRPEGWGAHSHADSYAERTMSHWARTLSWASLYEDNGLAGAISGSLHVMDPSMGGSGVGTGGHDGIDANALAVGAEKSRAKAQIMFMVIVPAQRVAARTQPRDSWHVEKGVAKGRSTAPLVCARWMMIVRRRRVAGSKRRRPGG